MRLLRSARFMYPLSLLLTIVALLTSSSMTIWTHASAMQTPIGMQSTLCQTDCALPPTAINIDQNDDEQEPEPINEIAIQPQLHVSLFIQNIQPSHEYSLGVIRPPDPIALAVLRF